MSEDNTPPAVDADLGVYTPAYLVWAFETMDDEQFKKSYSHPKSFVKEHYEAAKTKVAKQAKIDAAKAKIKAIMEEEEDPEVIEAAKSQLPREDKGEVTSGSGSSDIEAPPTPEKVIAAKKLENPAEVKPAKESPEAPQLDPVAKKATPRKATKRKGK